MKLKFKSKALLCLAIVSAIFGMGQGALAVERCVEKTTETRAHDVARDAALLNDSLYFAISQHDYDRVFALINMGADVNNVGLNGYTPIAIAVENWRNSAEIIELLLNRGANPNQGLHIRGYMPGTTAYRIFRERVFGARCVADRMAQFGSFPEELVSRIDAFFIAHNAE